MSKPKVSAPPPPPPVPPVDLREVDVELKKLGYVEGQSFGRANGGRRAAPESGMLRRAAPGSVVAPNQRRIDELLGYRKQFMEAEEKLRTQRPRSRMANVFAGGSSLSPANLASRTLLPG